MPQRSGACARCLAALAVAASASVHAAPIERLKIGGAVRLNYSYREWVPEYSHGGPVDFDTARINLDRGPWDWRFAYYPRNEGHGRGDSNDSARYSYDLVEDGGARNNQRNQLDARGAHTLAHRGGTTEIGASLAGGPWLVYVDFGFGRNHPVPARPLPPGSPPAGPAGGSGG